LGKTEVAEAKEDCRDEVFSSIVTDILENEEENCSSCTLSLETRPSIALQLVSRGTVTASVTRGGKLSIFPERESRDLHVESNLLEMGSTTRLGSLRRSLDSQNIGGNLS